MIKFKKYYLLCSYVINIYFVEIFQLMNRLSALLKTIDRIELCSIDPIKKHH